MKRRLLQLLFALPLLTGLLTSPALAFQDVPAPDEAVATEEEAAAEEESEPIDLEKEVEEQLKEAEAFLQRLMDDPGNTMKEWALDDGAKIGGKIGMFLLLLLIARVLSKVAAGVVRKTLSAQRLKLSDLLKNFAVNTVRNTIMFIGLLVAMGAIGIPIGPFLAAFGVVGFVIGFALQDTMANFASGVMILIYRPYDVGDFVNAGGETGVVQAMNLVSTTLLTIDNQVKIVPNGAIWGGVITNVTAKDTRRVDFVFGIGYGDDIEQAEKVLLSIAKDNKMVLDDPEPFIRVGELADSSVNFTVRLWAKTENYWDVHFDVIREVKLRFDKEGISIPFPQRDVHLHKVE